MDLIRVATGAERYCNEELIMRSHPVQYGDTFDWSANLIA